jgi:hypothetical protein
MEPIKPDVVARILKDRPSVSYSDIEEYQRLQVEHFMTNPFLPKSPEQEEETKKRESRMHELYNKLYE